MEKSYRQTLHSTSIMGIASSLNILTGMVRTKFAAILLGPAGVGLLGLYNQIITLVGTFTGMGIDVSGVRQIAEAFGIKDDKRISVTVHTIRRTVWLTGSLGLLFMVILCVPISRITFSSSDYALPIAFLGISLFFASISTGQASILRGTRRIPDIAKITVISALLSTLMSILCYYLWGVRGIVPGLVLGAAVLLATSWWFARRVLISPIALSLEDFRREVIALLGLGVSFMGAGLVISITVYAIQALLIRRFSLAEFGFYQAAYSLSGVLVNFVLNAMSADFYPRLTSAAGNNASVLEIVNEQSQISLLLALPGLAAMMVFSPFIILIFYSKSFALSLPILRWCILGMLGRIVSWPLGFVLLAKGMGRLFFMTQLFFCFVHFAFVFFFTLLWGLIGTGIAFMALYVVGTAMMLIIVHRLVGGGWSRSTLLISSLSTAVMVLLFINNSLASDVVLKWSVNLIVLAAVFILSIRHLSLKSGIGITSILSSLGRKERR